MKNKNETVLDWLLDSKNLTHLYDQLQKDESLLFEGLWDAPKALIASMALKATEKNILILTGATQEELRLYHDFPYFTEAPVVDFPAWETLPSENIAPSPDIVGERYKVLRQLSQSEQPHILISSLQAVLQQVISKDWFDLLYLKIEKGAEFVFGEFIETLLEMGYERCSIVADKGEFAVRGGIVDLFPVSSPDPVRIEFWGDEVVSLRTFDPVGQKSVASKECVEVEPARELELIKDHKELATLLDYLGENTIVILDDLLALEDRYASLASMSEGKASSLLSMEDFLTNLEKHKCIYFTQQNIEELSEVHYDKRHSTQGFHSSQAPAMKLYFQMFGRKLETLRWHSPFQPVARFLYPENPDAEELTGDEILYLLDGETAKESEIRLICSTESEENGIKIKLKDLEISLPSNVEFENGYLSSGFALQDAKKALLPSTEITHRYKLRRQKQRSTYHTPPTEVFELTPGDHVVHLNQGIGKFKGIQQKPNNQGVLTEYFQVDYANNGTLFVPINQAQLITKYVGASEEAPKLHKIGEARWKKTRERTEREIMGYAADLIHLYAHREVHGGFEYTPDGEVVQSFETAFPFVETEDQIRAIDDMKKDMCSKKAMDRLVCGDVGYGKTEVAMRAALKAVVDGGKQVAILVPTTMLAMQHYENFIERMEDFAIRVGVLSRFVTPKQVKATLKGVEEGTVDIVIGTHRIISGDVKFQNLGLIVIDEEQRFGVRVKEHLKKVKTGVDCLTLSATPIPRTLYMSLIGARDMSVISTPPQDRLPIKTVVAQDNDEMIKTALLRELMRDGQAFIIHNRVETIFEYATRIQKLLPQARVVVAHGQMHADEIDSVFHTFKNGEADIFIATTIIESGIDIPNANTILIDRADRFGLADLYQLRGRVGRWNRRAYAYFLVPSISSLPEISRKRLSALMETSGYGGGMKIAMRDLEIRGAGNLLGVEQSGHVSSVGFHLYCKMLKRAIKSLKGEIPSLLCDARVELPIDARLPEEYVDEVSLRMEFYQRFGEAISFEEVDHLLEELKDRFGEPPEQAVWLYHLTRMRVFASRHGIQLVKMEKVTLTTEQKRGEKVKSCKLMLKLPKTPEMMESVIIATLINQFNLKVEE